MGMDRAVVLLSGGMDSATLLGYVVRELAVSRVYALSFRYGQKHTRELETARWQAQAAGVAEHREADLTALGDLTAPASALTGAARPVPDLRDLTAAERRQPPTYVPHRNLAFLSLAAAYAEAVGAADVFYGAQAQDEYGYWDCTAEFVARLNRLLALNRGRPVTIHAPFAAKSKADVLALGLRLGVDFARTWSCYRGQAKPCGTCPSCVERAAAFRKAGAPDPLAVSI